MNKGVSVKHGSYDRYLHHLHRSHKIKPLVSATVPCPSVTHYTFTPGDPVLVHSHPATLISLDTNINRATVQFNHSQTPTIVPLHHLQVYRATSTAQRCKDKCGKIIPVSFIDRILDGKESKESLYCMLLSRV